jgi:hypothetical protein
MQTELLTVMRLTERRTALTIDEHREIGAILHNFDRRLGAVLAQLSNRHEVKVRLLDRLLDIDRRLGQVRSELEDVLFRQYPRDPRAGTSVYYPSNSDGSFPEKKHPGGVTRCATSLDLPFLKIVSPGYGYADKNQKGVIP